VGDNPGKDFQAPRQLGMRWIYFQNPDGLYSVSGGCMPCVSSIQDIENKIKQVIG
jgi:FMN phosphatase YigB (HAD superfamily)